MKKFLTLLSLVFMLGLSACSQVPAGFVGVKVYMLGGAKGVDHEVLPVGRYWIGMNEQLFTFPVFSQNYIWTASKSEGRPEDESFTFQTKEGLTVNTDIGISYEIDPTKVSIIFQKYRKGIDEITHIFVRNMVRDALNKAASTMTVEEVYGPKKSDLLLAAQKDVAAQTKDIGIIIDKLYLVGSMRLPETVVAALNSKITATQNSMKVENEVAQAKAEAEKTIVAARAEAESNRLKLQTITPALIQFNAVQKWDGHLSTFSGSGTTPFINLNGGLK